MVPAEWIAQATTPQGAADGYGYGYGSGYQWWTSTVHGDEACRAVGFGGQLIEAVPDRNPVKVTTAEVRLDDATSQGIDPNVLGIVEDAGVSQFPSG